VRKKFATACLLLAWLCANGAVTDIAQIFAWGRMFAGYARVLSVSEALVETFDANKPCEICLAVKKDRASEGQPVNAAASTEKIFLVCSTVPSSEVFTPPGCDWREATDWEGITRDETVPLRPPRA
jgi:hypothetical protein